eukprot:2744318-Ditylum_brightwellii.AAC.1
MDDNMRELHSQGKMVHTQGTDKDLAQHHEAIKELKIKASKLQNLASKLKLDVSYRASYLARAKWEGLMFDQEDCCDKCSAKMIKANLCACVDCRLEYMDDDEEDWRYDCCSDELHAWME